MFTERLSLPSFASAKGWKAACSPHDGVGKGPITLEEGSEGDTAENASSQIADKGSLRTHLGAM